MITFYFPENNFFSRMDMSVHEYHSYTCFSYLSLSLACCLSKNLLLLLVKKQKKSRNTLFCICVRVCVCVSNALLYCAVHEIKLSLVSSALLQTTNMCSCNKNSTNLTLKIRIG